MRQLEVAGRIAEPLRSRRVEEDDEETTENTSLTHQVFKAALYE